MNRRLGHWTLILICLAPATAYSSENETLDQIRHRWEALYRDRAESLSVSFAESGQRAIRLQPQPVLTYTNPVRNGFAHGSVFLWTEAGRPVLAAAFWSVREPDDPAIRRLSREWHSLTTDELAIDDGETLWTSIEPGIEWKPLEDVDRPRNSRRVRLTQMRQIARRLHAEIETAEGELRLMPQPIYRYPESTGVLDGGVFAFGLGTDPELLALIEARESPDGATDWLLGFVHFTNAPVNVSFDGIAIYEAPRWSPTESAGRHHLGIAVEHHPADLAEEADLPE